MASQRDETVLPISSNDLAVARETVQPAHVSLWLDSAPGGAKAKVSRQAQRLVYPCGGSPAHREYAVRVAVKSEVDAGVAEEVLNVLRVRATGEQQCGARVAEIVPAYIR